jgi:peptidyl-prolyl cis-trans isomerase C
MKPNLFLAAILSLTTLVPLAVFGEPQASRVAVVNGVAIPQDALDAALKQAQANGLSDSAELRTALKSQLIARELFRQEAEKRNLGADPEVAAAVAQARESAMVQKFLRTGVKPDPVTDQQVREHYDSIVAALGPTEYKASLVQVGDEATAKLVLTQLKNGKPFEQAAREHSKAPSSKQGGAIDWMSFKLPVREGQTHGFPSRLADALTKLKPATVTAEPVLWNNAYFLLRLDASRPTQVPEFEKVKPALRATLERKELERASTSFVAELVKASKIQP